MMGVSSRSSSPSPPPMVSSPTQTDMSFATEATETPEERTFEEAQHPAEEGDHVPEHPTDRRRSLSDGSLHEQRPWAPSRASSEIERKDTLRPNQSVSQPTTTASSPALPSAGKPKRGHPLHDLDRKRSIPSSVKNGRLTGELVLKGTIARASVDSTLAVIPAGAFKRLTRNFPKATGAIVQVVLERFNRVTFMTGVSPH